MRTNIAVYNVHARKIRLKKNTHTTTYFYGGNKRLVTSQGTFGQNIFTRALEVEVSGVECSEMRISPDRTNSGAFVLRTLPLAQIAFTVRAILIKKKKNKVNKILHATFYNTFCV